MKAAKICPGSSISSALPQLQSANTGPMWFFCLGRARNQQQPFLVLNFRVEISLFLTVSVFLKFEKNKAEQLELYYSVEWLLLIRNWNPTLYSSSVEICQVNRNHLIKAPKQLCFIF